MSPTESVSSVFRNYINFKGRAQRSEFWWFTLFTVIVSVVLGILGSALPALNILEGIYSLAVLLPSLAVTVRRLHDTNRPAWWLLIYLAVFLAWVIGGIILAVSIGIDDPDVLETDFQDWPGYTAYIIACILFSLAGAATMIVICAQRGTAGANRYGPDPHSLQRERRGSAATATRIPAIPTHRRARATAMRPRRNPAGGNTARNAARNGRRGMRGFAPSAAPSFDI